MGTGSGLLLRSSVAGVLALALAASASRAAHAENADEELPRVVIQGGPAVGFLFGFYSFENESTVGFAGTAAVRVWRRLYLAGRYAYEDLPPHYTIDAEPGFVSNHWDVGLRYYAPNSTYAGTRNSWLFFGELMVGATVLSHRLGDSTPNREGTNVRVGGGVAVQVHEHAAFGVAIGFMHAFLEGERPRDELEVFDASAFLQFQY
ncbi:MAG TPA: hypothetical protein PLF40_06765 [Kofleriaceae bacterium]|nr:hypothetical protein [Kofleriaceae bacterium]